MQTTTPNVEAVLDRFDTVTREAMIQLARWKSERMEWRDERDEMHRKLRRASSQDAQLVVIPLQTTLQRAIAHIDRILAQGAAVSTLNDEPAQVKS